MIKINDYATKNHLNNWEIKELPDNKGEWKVDHKEKLFFWGNNVWGYYRLDLPNGDLSILFYLADIQQLNRSIFFIPSLPDNKTIIDKIDNLFYTGFGRAVCPVIYTLDNSSCTKTGVVQNITPDWSKYIAEDNAVLFLSGEDANRYSNISYENFTKIIYENDTFSMQDDSLGYVKNDNVLEWNKKISIILPSIHSQNIKEISNIANDLKENYGVEYVEIIATHCYLKENKFVKYDYTGGYKGEASFRYNNIDKIITTDSTGVLEVQDTNKLKVIDCEEFFNL